MECLPRGFTEKFRVYGGHFSYLNTIQAFIRYGYKFQQVYSGLYQKGKRV